MLTAPSLFLDHPPSGPHRCFYCGTPCGEGNPVATYVKDSFTGRNGVVARGSPWVCDGCVLCLREDAEIVQLDGECRSSQMMRGYSWLCRPGDCLAGTKRHIEQWRSLCLNPPEPPFAIVLSDSGQKHLLYRGVVNHSRDQITVTLEGDPVSFKPDQLREALLVSTKIAAATGKPALSEPINFGIANRVMGYFQEGEAILDAWGRLSGSPLARLAAWLTPNKEVSASVYPSDIAPVIHDAGHGGVPAKTGGPDRSTRSAVGARRKDRDPRPSPQALLDFGEPL